MGQFTPKVTPTTAARMVTDSLAGETQATIARKYGVSQSTVARVIRGRDRKPPRELAPCGTNAAYQRHLYNKQVPCDPCTAAHTADQAQRRSQCPTIIS